MFLYKATYIAFKVYIFYVLRMYFLRIEPKILASMATEPFNHQSTVL